MVTEKITNEFFTSLPIEEQIPIVRKAYQKRLVHSLNSLVGAAERGLKKDLSFLKNKFLLLDHMSRFSPRLYYLHHRLQSDMRASDPKAVETTLALLQEFKENEIYAPILKLSFSIQEDWESFIVGEAHKSTAVDARGRRAVIRNAQESKFQEIRPLLLATLELLEKHDPVIRRQIDEYVSRIKIFEGEGIVGMTDVRIFGAVFLRLPEGHDDPIAYFSEHLIHESSHLHLNVLMAEDPIVLNSSEELYPAPIRLDPRPMYGIFHATYVLSRIVRFFRLMAKVYPERESFHKTLSIVEKQFDKGLDVVSNFARCTDFGNQIVKSFISTANSLL